VKYRKLGRTGLEVSALGLGTVELGQDWGIQVPGEYGEPSEEAAMALLARAVEVGVNFLDTARVYKKSEERIGKFLKTLGRDASRVYVATKVFMNKKEGPRAMREGMVGCLERSLKALDVECVDLIQLHSARLADITDSTAWEVLDKARDQGKLRFIGATHYDAEAATAAVESGAYDTIQPTYNPAMFWAGPVIDMAAEKEVGVIVKTPLLKGAFSYKREHLEADMAGTGKVVEEFRFLERSDQTLPQACIRFCLARPGTTTVIAGTQRVAHLEENVEAVEGELLPEELSRIEELQRELDFDGVEIP
jgi:aryl-alcohol dehydrogenase-like predicted oxidoreductase